MHTIANFFTVKDWQRFGCVTLLITACLIAGDSITRASVRQNVTNQQSQNQNVERDAAQNTITQNNDTQNNTAQDYVRQLASRDASVRLRAAEELAQQSAVEQKRLIEGYRLQEKDKRVQLALDWALYRTGDEQSLFRIVDALNANSRRLQALSYLSRLDAPEPLYMFLTSPKRKIQTGVITALGRIGNADTLTKIEPYMLSPDADVVISADEATKQINLRLSNPLDDINTTRPRQIGNRSDDNQEPPRR